MRTGIATVCLAVLLPVLAVGQSRYQSWQAPEERSQQILDELDKLVSEAERDRAADPRFLADLRALIRRFETPWRSLLISEDFRDGDYTQNPTWSVASGNFRVAYGDGLISNVTAVAATPAPEEDKGKPATEDVAIQLLGQLLGQKEQARTEAPRADDSVVAEIYLPHTITNAFAISIVMSARGDRSQGEFAVYQGEDRKLGYALAYTKGQELVLLRRTSRGEAVVQTAKPASDLFDGEQHTILWTRHPDGTMAVSVDANGAIEVVDRGFKDPFQGFRFRNQGGEQIMHSLRIDGTP